MPLILKKNERCFNKWRTIKLTMLKQEEKTWKGINLTCKFTFPLEIPELFNQTSYFVSGQQISHCWAGRMP
jgi:hypothetical protein